MAKTKFIDRLRQLLRESGMQQKEISEATGVDRAVVSKFINGQVGLSMESINALAEYFGWEIVVKKKAK
jgi:transcriptional regulator with XRE-family HTH domain